MPFFTLSTLYFANINFREHKFSRTLIFANFAIGNIWTFREHLISRLAIFGNFANIYFREFRKCWRIYPQLMIIFSKKMSTKPLFWFSFSVFKFDEFLTWLEKIYTKLFLINYENRTLIFASINFRDTLIFASASVWIFREHLISRNSRKLMFAKINVREN